MIGEHSAGKGPHNRSNLRIFSDEYQRINFHKEETTSCPRCGRGKRAGVVCNHDGRFSYPTQSKEANTQVINNTL